MLQATVRNVISHYVAFDILDHGGVRVSEEETLIESFDVRKKCVLIPPQAREYVPLFHLISRELDQWEHFRSAHKMVRLCDDQRGCRLEIVDSNSLRAFKDAVVPFAKRDWAIIEDVLITMGFHMTARLETSIKVYTYNGVRLELNTHNDRTDLVLEAKNTDELIAALTASGFTIDEAKITQ